MLSNNHFYHRITRKIVVAFGTIFNNIRLVRYNNAGTVEIERINVPLSYMPKEKFYQRITQDPELLRETGINLPRMVFELNSITYDPLRKTSLFNRQFAPDPTNSDVIKSVASAPYNFDFTLTLYARNTEDGIQVVEQILPYFTPDYTVSVVLTQLNNLKVDVPIVLNTVQSDVSDAVGSPNDLRVLTWTLTFTAKAILYGPIANSKMIRAVTANTFYFNTDSFGTKILNLQSGSGSYKIGELVYEGETLSTANGSGFVDSWSPASNTLTIVDSTGTISTGKKLRGAVSGAAWNIASYQTADYKLQHLTVEPNPYAANANDDFGFLTTIVDF